MHQAFFLMTETAEKMALFTTLRQILARYSDQLKVVTDEEGNYHLDTHHVMKNKKPLFFGAVRSNKNYVSFHLMPIYVNPSLLDAVDLNLKKRMQGKSCFNFTSIDDKLIDGLVALTESGYQYYVEESYIQGNA